MVNDEERKTYTDRHGNVEPDSYTFTRLKFLIIPKNKSDLLPEKNQPLHMK